MQSSLYLQNEKTIESIESAEVIKLIESIYKNIYDITNPRENSYFKEILKSFENRNYISKKHI